MLTAELGIGNEESGMDMTGERDGLFSEFSLAGAGRLG